MKCMGMGLSEPLGRGRTYFDKQCSSADIIHKINVYYLAPILKRLDCHKCHANSLCQSCGWHGILF